MLLQYEKLLLFHGVYTHIHTLSSSVLLGRSSAYTNIIPSFITSHRSDARNRYENNTETKDAEQ